MLCNRFIQQDYCSALWDCHFFVKCTMVHSVFALEGIIINRLPFGNSQASTCVLQKCHLCRQRTRFWNRANEGANAATWAARHQHRQILCRKTQMLSMCDLMFDCVPLFAMFMRYILSVNALFCITHSHTCNDMAVCFWRKGCVALYASICKLISNGQTLLIHLCNPPCVFVHVWAFSLGIGDWFRRVNSLIWVPS